MSATKRTTHATDLTVDITELLDILREYMDVESDSDELYLVKNGVKIIL